MGRTSKNQYLTSQQIYEEWRKWKETGTISETMGRYMLTLATHIMQSKSFVRYPHYMKEDMIQEGCIKIQRNLCNMKEEMKSSFFAYWSRCVFTAAITYLKKYYTQQNRQREYVKGQLEAILYGDEHDIKQSQYLKKILHSLEHWNERRDESAEGDEQS